MTSPEGLYARDTGPSPVASDFPLSLPCPEGPARLRALGPRWRSTQHGSGIGANVLARSHFRLASAPCTLLVPKNCFHPVSISEASLPGLRATFPACHRLLSASPWRGASQPAGSGLRGSGWHLSGPQVCARVCHGTLPCVTDRVYLAAGGRATELGPAVLRPAWHQPFLLPPAPGR